MHKPWPLLALAGCPYLWGPPEYADPLSAPANDADTDIDIELMDAAGALLATSASDAVPDALPYALTAGVTYQARVVGRDGVDDLDYEVLISR